MKTVTKTYFTFEELNKEQQEACIEAHYDLNHDLDYGYVIGNYTLELAECALILLTYSIALAISSHM